MKTKVAYIGLKVREENWRRDMDLGIMILKRLDEFWEKLSCQERE